MTTDVTNMLKELRRSRKMTQEQLGYLAGMSKSQICRMEKGTLGSEETIGRVLEALGYATELRVIDKRSEVNNEREAVLDILRVFKKNNAEKYGIESLALFGSMARNEQREDSDVDILIELKEPSLYLYAEIADILKSVLSRKVDLVSAKATKRNSFKEEIVKDIIYV